MIFFFDNLTKNPNLFFFFFFFVFFFWGGRGGVERRGLKGRAGK